MTKLDVLTYPRLKPKDIVIAKAKILALQNGKCGLCPKEPLLTEAVLDHCHLTGQVRGVLCTNCNGMEGKIANAARRSTYGGRSHTAQDFIRALLVYWNKPLYPVLYATVRTTDEKRDLRNKRARRKTKQAREAKCKPSKINSTSNARCKKKASKGIKPRSVVRRRMAEVPSLTTHGD
jgi:hypothetical protein